MYVHCFFSLYEGSILADMSTRRSRMPEKRARESSQHTEIVVCGMESLNALNEALALECEKAAAVKVQHEADAAGFHPTTARSAALGGVLSVIARLDGKIEEEESKETSSEDRIYMYKTLREQQYNNLKSHR
jgi:hypothetical protein